MLVKTRKKMLIFTLILILLLVGINWTRGRERISFVEDAFTSLVAPVQEFFTNTGFQVRSLVESIGRYRDLEKEVNKLKKRLAANDSLQNEIIELKKENERLRKMLDFKLRSEYELIPAEVIARDPSQWFESIVINKGYKDGVRENMPVVTDNGLVGSIMSVSRSSSRVLLLTDPRRAVGALVQRSRDPGIVGVVESYPENQEYLKMINIPSEASIKPGDTIISSGLGGYFPKGLVIGEVVELKEDQYSMLQYALIKPAVNFNRLEEVFVVSINILPGEEAEASAK